MNTNTSPKDLIFLVADKDMEYAMKGLLSRCNSLGIRTIDADIRRHPHKDSGCRTGGAEFLSTFQHLYTHAILMFDLEGSGSDLYNPEEIEQELEKILQPKWGEQGAVVVIAPELEIWIWSDSPHVDRILDWNGRIPDLRSWIVSQDYQMTKGKPSRPKEALEAALKEVRKPRTSVIYQSLAESISLNRCNDRAFIRLKEILKRWFSIKDNS